MIYKFIFFLYNFKIQKNLQFKQYIDDTAIDF